MIISLFLKRFLYTSAATLTMTRIAARPIKGLSKASLLMGTDSPPSPPPPCPITNNWSCVVCVRPPPVPVTVMVYDPVGVLDEVLMVRVAVKVGEPVSDGVNAHEAPVGSPEVHETVTAWELPSP